MKIGDIEPLNLCPEREPIMRIPPYPVHDKKMKPHLEIVKDNEAAPDPSRHEALGYCRSHRHRKGMRKRGNFAKLTFLNIA
jgi:hypothetical protein